jgi:hypothetical protein
MDGQGRVAGFGVPDPGSRWRKPVGLEVGAKFDSPRSSEHGGIDTFRIAAANFQEGHPVTFSDGV